MSTESKQIRAAEKTVNQARKTLAKAEAGLQAAERVSEKAESSRPVLKATMKLAFLAIVGTLVFLARRES
jgi:hypothetical protein